MIEYCLHPGHVISRTDGDRHYVGVSQLMSLYGLKNSECWVRYDMTPAHIACACLNAGVMTLYPRADGRYDLLDRVAE